MDVLRNTPELIAALTSLENDTGLRADLLAMKTPEFLESKVGNSPVVELREQWAARQEAINDDTIDAVAALRRDLLRLLEVAESSKRKVLTLTRWKGRYPPTRAPKT